MFFWQVMLDHPSCKPQLGSSVSTNSPIDLSNVDTRLPMLVYISREKRPGYDNQKKAGAMNVMLRVSALLSNAPFVINFDCDHYINNSHQHHPRRVAPSNSRNMENKTHMCGCSGWSSRRWPLGSSPCGAGTSSMGRAPPVARELLPARPPSLHRPQPSLVYPWPPRQNSRHREVANQKYTAPGVEIGGIQWPTGPREQRGGAQASHGGGASGIPWYSMEYQWFMQQKR